MKFEPERLLAAADPRARAPGWGLALPLLGATLCALVAIYWTTARSVAAIWGSSDTYAHGYLMIPITLGLVWMKRVEAGALTPRPDPWGYLLLGATGFAWLVAEAGQVQVLRQYALVAMIPATVLALAGRRVAWTLAFPLSFVLLAVPFGEAFLPRLMDWTADFAVAALRLTGIPVYREGTFFSLPSGNWSVVEACSGLRYLIASITVGTLYAYLTYQNPWKRLVCVSLSVLLPIGANFVRAYTVVMVGHLTNMRYAVGIDHIIYGWLFFGLVMFIFFWLGSFWRDPTPSPRVLQGAPGSGPTFGAMVSAALAVPVVAAAWPLYAAYLDRPDSASVLLTPPAQRSGWTIEPQSTIHWHPHFGGVTDFTLASYRNGERSVAVYLGYYRHQRQGAELVSSQNFVAGGRDSPWSSMGQGTRIEGDLALRETRLRSNQGRLLAWDWYRVAGRDTANPYLAKALLARDKLLGRGDASAAIVLAAPYESRPEAAAETLRLFVRDMLPAIRETLP